MSVVPAHSSSNLVERLAEFDALRAVPEAERAWLVAHGEHRVHEAGDVLLTPADESQEMIVLLSGLVVVYFGHGAGRRHSAQSKAGSITGLLPFSRLKRPPSNVLVEERTERWRASWDASLRATREATTTTQDALAELGLEPAREEALR